MHAAINGLTGCRISLILPLAASRAVRGSGNCIGVEPDRIGISRITADPDLEVVRMEI